MATVRLENSYAGLPEQFFARIHPEAASHAQLIRLNGPLAIKLGLDIEWLESEEGVAMLSGSKMPEGVKPVAMAYAGHQFGNWVPQLGDGRAHLLGETVAADGTRFDIHLKGSGRTPFSRNGDGRAALGPVLREYLVSEWFAAMGISASRSLAAVLTGDTVYREQPLPGAVLVRVARSHVRVGTFQYFAARGEHDSVRTLADYLIGRHFPELAGREDRYLAMFAEIAARQAELIARWMGVGFIHGVMNTDNMQLVGETIDFGPCAFMDGFRFDKVFSSIDRYGRYAWNRQPEIARWNLARLAETMLQLFAADQQQAIAAAESVLHGYNDKFERSYTSVFAAKLGLDSMSAGKKYIDETLTMLQAQQVDFTLFFRRLTQVAAGGDESTLLSLFSEPDAGRAWLQQWQAGRESLADRPAGLVRMRLVNPVYIPRNHRIEQVIGAANHGDFTLFHQLVELLANPCSEQPGLERYELPPEPHEEVTQTFCGT